jgi:hypothetical protein
MVIVGRAGSGTVAGSLLVMASAVTIGSFHATTCLCTRVYTEARYL